MSMQPPGHVTPTAQFQFPSVGNYIPDERDHLISWLRAEFAAANSIIDSLCLHLQAIGDPNEYDVVIANIQHRRLSWNQVLIMQQFYPVADVSTNLQLIALKKTQQQEAQRHYHRVEEAKLANDVKALSVVAEDKRDGREKAKTFVVKEMYGSKMVNVVEGLKLYDKLLDAKEVSRLVSIVNGLKVAGRKGQLQSDAYVAYKHPNRGHGREMIQLGLPIADDESIKDGRIEPIPLFLQDIIERLVSEQIIPVKPDACIVDFFNEGDHSQPHKIFPWFGRPVGILSLSECDFTFGRVIVFDHPGDYKGSLKLSLTPGSVLLVEGKCADLAKYAIHSTRKQRILITFTKYKQRNSKTASNCGQSRSLNNFPAIPTTGVFPTPSNLTLNEAAQSCLSGPSPPLTPSKGRPLLHHQRQAQPRMPIPGTGVFLPPEKCNSSNGSNYEECTLNSKRKEEAEEWGGHEWKN